MKTDSFIAHSVVVSLMEVARNVLDHEGGDGYVIGQATDDGVSFSLMDRGPGVHCIDDVLAGSFKSDKGLGLGLSGVERLMDEL